MTSDILKRAAEAQTESKAYFEANGIVVTDPGLVPELIVENARLTARAEAAYAETLEQARLLGMGAERELALMAKADRWERMADRLAEVMNDIRDYATILASDGQHRVLREVLAAHAAMKEGR